MVARVDDKGGEFLGIQRTFLRPGLGRLDRRMLGPVRGGAVRLAPPARRLGLAEGIETALSVVVAMPELSVWATLSTAGLRSVELPALPLASEVTIFADNDPPGLEAARCAGERLVREGRKVKIAKPPDGANDFNDILRGVG